MNLVFLLKNEVGLPTWDRRHLIVPCCPCGLGGVLGRRHLGGSPAAGEPLRAALGIRVPARFSGGVVADRVSGGPGVLGS